MTTINNIDLNSLLGNTLTEELLDSLRESISNVRVKKPGFLYTQEFKTSRVNIHVDENDVIIKHSIG